VSSLPLTPLSLTFSSPTAWNAALAALPYAHVLQSWEWGEFKRVTTGWQPLRLAWEQDGAVVAMASVGIRRVSMFTLMYAPKGPALAYEDPALVSFVLDELQSLARKRGAVWLKIDPDVIAATGVPGESNDTPDPTGSALTSELGRRGWRFSGDQVQFRNTIKLDLTPPEDAILAAMGQSTRRKIRLAEREGVTVRNGTLDDLPILYDLYKVTGERDDFLIRPPSYYEEAWRRFIAAGIAHPLIAEADGQAIAHVILFRFGKTCWYFYGASSNDAREKMPNYLLQWESIRWAKAQGCTIYDFWGAPDHFDETDRLWGVYQFKRGFHGAVTRHIGAWDYAPSAPLYAAYVHALPRLRGLLRRG